MPHPLGARLAVTDVSAVEEMVFHQVLAWHHLYDRSTGRPVDRKTRPGAGTPTRLPPGAWHTAGEVHVAAQDALRR